MKIICLSLLVLLVSAPAWALSYSFEIKAQINDEKLIKAHVVVKEGATGSFIYEGTTVKFTPIKIDSGSVQIQAEILKKTGHGMKSVSKPSAVVLLNQPAVISQKSDDGSEILHLTLTPKQI